MAAVFNHLDRSYASYMIAVGSYVQDQARQNPSMERPCFKAASKERRLLGDCLRSLEVCFKAGFSAIKERRFQGDCLRSLEVGLL